MSKPILVRTWNKRFCYNDIVFDFFIANRDKTNQEEELVEDDNGEDMYEDEIADKVVSSKFVTTVLLMYSLFRQYDKITGWCLTHFLNLADTVKNSQFFNFEVSV